MLHLRPIAPEDDPAIATIIRKVMSEFKADPKTTILGDPSLDHMYSNYQESGAAYFIAEWNGEIMGGCGIRQLAGSTEKICELQRLFILQEARGKGIGKALMDKCLQLAEEFGYEQMYIETLSDMHAARSLYRQYGFEEICGAMGNTGHCGCDVNMLKKLKEAQPL